MPYEHRCALADRAAERTVRRLLFEETVLPHAVKVTRRCDDETSSRIERIRSDEVLDLKRSLQFRPIVHRLDGILGQAEFRRLPAARMILLSDRGELLADWNGLVGPEAVGRAKLAAAARHSRRDLPL